MRKAELLRPESIIRNEKIKSDPCSRTLGKPVIYALDIETTGPINPQKPGNFKLVRCEKELSMVKKTPVHQIIELGIVRLDVKTGEVWPVYE